MARYRIETSDKQEHETCLRGRDWAWAFQEYAEWLRNQIKYNGDKLTGEQLSGMQIAKDKIYEILSEECLSFDKIG